MVDCECQEKSIEKTHSIRKDKRTNLKELPEKEKSLKLILNEKFFKKTKPRPEVIVVKKETRIEIRSETGSHTSCSSDITFDFLAQPTVNYKFQENLVQKDAFNI